MFQQQGKDLLLDDFWDFRGGDRLVLVIEAEGRCDGKLMRDVFRIFAEIRRGRISLVTAAELHQHHLLGCLLDDLAHEAVFEDDPVIDAAGKPRFLWLRGAREAR